MTKFWAGRLRGDSSIPKRAKLLSAAEVRRLGAGLHAVGGVAGLALQVSNTGGRSWILRVRVGGKRREIGLGGYPEVSLGRARERAAEAKDAIRRGIDPVEERKAAKAALAAAQREGVTFAKAFERFAATKLPELSTERYRDQWMAVMQKHALPELGNMLVRDITRADVLRVLTPIWETRTETATKVR